MKSRVTQVLESRPLVLLVHAAIWLLLYLAVAGIRGTSPDFRESEPRLGPVPALLPATAFAGLFAGKYVPPPVAGTNVPNAFYTLHFMPKLLPPAPPPTTRKIELTYAGFYEASDGVRRVMVRLGDAFLTAPVGARLTANLYAASAAIQTLVLTNPAAQTNVLPLNLKKELEVPIQ